MQDDISTLRQAVLEFSELHQHIGDAFVRDLLRKCGPQGLDLLAEMIREQVAAADELIATFCAKLAIRSRMPGRVGLILEALRLPFQSWIRNEIRETIFDWAVEDPEFRTDPRMVAAAEEISATWFNTQLEYFLREARPDAPPNAAGI